MTIQVQQPPKHFSRCFKCEAETVNNSNPDSPFLQTCGTPYKRRNRQNRQIPFCERHIKQYVRLAWCKIHLNTLSNKHQMMLEALQQFPGTDSELSKRLFLAINKTRQRRRKLVSLGLVCSVQKRVCAVSTRLALEWQPA